MNNKDVNMRISVDRTHQYPPSTLFLGKEFSAIILVNYRIIENIAAERKA